VLNRVDLTLLSFLTLFWGINWPIMKYAVLDYAPLTFRSLSMVIGILAIGLYIVLRKESFFVPKPGAETRMASCYRKYAGMAFVRYLRN